MSDATVSAALRSSARLVVIEAPAGCGKTWQGTQYAQEIAGTMGDGRVLILAHTHAATDVFASRTRGVGKRIEIRAIIPHLTFQFSHAILRSTQETRPWLPQNFFIK